MPVATIVSYRLGGNDGVAVEARKWEWALRELGYEVRRVAGALEDGPGPDDAVVPGLTIPDPSAGTDGPWAEPLPGPAALRALLDTDLVVVENLCSLPLNPAAARAVGEAASGLAGHVVLRHHDVPWQRLTMRDLEAEFPSRVPGALNATINLRTRRELQARNYEHATTIHNYFDLDAPHGERAATRAEFGFADDDLVLLQPSRAIPRKNVPGGIRAAAAIAAALSGRTVRYWLTGPAEDGYAPTLDKLIDRAPVPVTIGRARSSADAYAACDAVLFASTWEGFGNPTIESIWARRPAMVFPYPVLAEIVACGLRFFEWDEPLTLARFLAQPREQFFETNLRRARISFSLPELPAAIDAAFGTMGWSR